ncbi:adenosine deaminase-like isoform X2 [Amblyomma americanum]
MSFLRHFDASKIPRTRVELHLHLDGSIRLETIWELARGDLEAVERISYELCEDQAREGVAYFEARYSPHFLASKEKNVTVRQVVEAVNRGLQRGQHDFKVMARSIIACVLGNDEWSAECLKLCEEYECKGVVGIDIAKDEARIPEFTKGEIKVYERAKQLGIPRTAHAGESGDYRSVRDAMLKLYCDRVGHGYRVFQDPTGDTYRMAREKNLHFETCPYSSVLTGGCPLGPGKHSIVRFAEDNANFSISKDDSTITGSTLNDEYDFLTQLGLTEAHLIRANLNAARSSFLRPAEKECLVQDLLREYGVLPGKEEEKRPIEPMRPMPPWPPKKPEVLRKPRGLLARLLCCDHY